MRAEPMATPSKTLNVNATLARAKSHVKKGQLDEARQLYHRVLDVYSQNQQAKKGLKALQKGQRNKKNSSNPPQAQIDAVISLYSRGQVQEALSASETLVKDYPTTPLLYNISAACYQALGQLDAAVKCYEQALAIQPDFAEAHSNLGVTLKDLGQLDAAVKCYEQALAIQPDYAEAYNNLGITLNELGQLEEAVKRYEQALAIKPDYAEAHSNLGITLQELGQLEEAVKCYEQALAIKPDYAETHYNLGNTLQELGQLDAAVKSYEQALAIKPDYAEAHYNLGNTVKELGQLEAAAKCYEQALAIKPDYAEVHYNLGLTLQESGQLEAAVKSYEQVLAIKPDYAEAHSNLGITLKELGQLEAAIKSYEQATAIKPDFAEAHNNLGVSLQELGQLEVAVKCFEQALAIKPDFAEAHSNLGLTLHELGQLYAAAKRHEQAIAIKPDFAEAHNNLGNTLQELGQLDAAVKSYEQALAIKPDYAEPHSNLGNTLQELGQLDVAVKSYEQALAIKPDFAEAHSNLLFALNYHPDLSAEAIFEFYQEYDQRFGMPYRDQWQDHANTKNLTRRLKIGYVSPDFRSHSMNHFLAPLLDHHNRDEFEIYAYAEIIKEDKMTEFYKNSADHWIKTNNISDDALSELIRSHEIDILIDLAGHTKENRLGVFARKPAPVSVSMFGYGYTTGLSAIDYFVGDEALFPEGCKHLFSEHPFRLPSPGFCYQPTGELGKVNNLPALEKGYVTFGTLTRSVRINHKTIQVWSEVLKQVKDSKLILNSKSFVDSNFQKTMAGRFSAEGISRDRLIMGFNSPPWDVLRQIDISFDCFPHNSGNTLLESLYLGVPYITLSSRPSVGRIGASILIAVNNSEWIAETEKEYIDKAVALASNLPDLAKIRSQLRAKLQSSPITNEIDFVKKLEIAYRQMWKKWCENGLSDL